MTQVKIILIKKPTTSKATQQENQDSLLPQNNDVYERPKESLDFQCIFWKKQMKQIT
ncbi:hypothetical protein J4710_03365 [Staphylococcus xylosus]|uniref:Uncharacterized protein n=1 Tax=Staphylococcus xylosus TaxID=1288 RepID=A0A939NIP5_STAXY|nr:hypothetical protein [Staphylococcus xylosus]